jgi:hypothetical protein
MTERPSAPHTHEFRGGFCGRVGTPQETLRLYTRNEREGARPLTVAG